MNRDCKFAIALLGVTASPVALGQSASPYSQQFAPQSDADILAAQMRQLAENPQNIYALIAAGNLTLKLGDAQAAAALFARAEKVDFNNARVKAGMAATLVHSERPGEALQLYARASALGATERDFGSDRGLAYDLIGDHGRAQRDYRSVLARGNDDETVRRYALSLGISGQKDRALALLEPLNRKSDRGAWRARAFVLAMNGDRAGAEKIATSMMPAGMAQGLRPFFDRLPKLSSIDRAYAVHFGEVRATPARYADIALAPRQTPLPPEPAPISLASVRRAAPALSKREQRKLERDAKKRERSGMVQVAAAAPAPVPLPIPPAPSARQLASIAPNLSSPYAYPTAPRSFVPDRNRSPFVQTPPPSRTAPPAATAAPSGSVTAFNSTMPRVEPNGRMAAVTPAPARAASSGTVTSGTGPVVSLPIVEPTTGSTRNTVGAATVSRTPMGPAFDGRVASPAAEARSTDSAPNVSNPALVSSGSGVSTGFIAAPTPSAVPAGVAVSSLGTPTANSEPTSGVTTFAASPVSTPTGVDIATAPVSTSAPGLVDIPVSSVAMPAPIVASAGVTGTSGGDAATAGKSAPAAAGPAPSTQAASLGAPPAPAGPKGDAILAAIVAQIAVPANELTISPPPRKVGATPPDAKPAGAKIGVAKSLDAKPAVDPKAKAAADAKAKADAKIKAEAKAKSDAKAKADKERNDPAKLEPARFWVQVAGGANEGDLAKEWKRLAAKAPAAFKGRAPWTTPLRATNRVLTGPFKSQAEARAFVNQLSALDISAFTFSSEAGQKIGKLPLK